MFQDYNDIKNFIIEELINQNSLTTDLFLEILADKNLLDFVIDNINLKNNIETQNCEFFFNDYFIGSIVKKDKLLNLQDKKSKLYILRELLDIDSNSKMLLTYALLDYNSDQLIKNDINVDKLSIELNFRDIVEQKLILKDGIYMEDSKCLIKYNLFFDKKLIGIYEGSEQFLLPRHLNDFIACTKIINSVKRVDKKDLDSISSFLKINNQIYKNVLEKQVDDKLNKGKIKK